MADMRDLDPDTRSHALVGRFMLLWSAVEFQLRQVIGKALGLDSTQTLIVTANMATSDKIYTARTVVDVSLLAEVDKKRYNKLLIDIARWSAP